MVARGYSYLYIHIYSYIYTFVSGQWESREPEQWEHRWEFAVGTLRDITMAEWIYAQWFMKDSNC